VLVSARGSVSIPPVYGRSDVDLNAMVGSKGSPYGIVQWFYWNNGLKLGQMY